MKELLKEVKDRLLLAKKALFGEIQVSTQRKGFDMAEINDRDKKIREFLKKEESNELKTCPTCGSKVKETHKCAKCGKEICDECGTFCAAPETFSPEIAEKSGYYCEDCW